MNAYSDVIGVVMLGGASSRMGSDKSELYLEGRTLAQRATDILYNAGIKDVVISSGDKTHGIQDQVSGKGPIGGMHAVVKQCSTKSLRGFIFLPVDMPLIPTDLIKLLVISGFDNSAACQFKEWPLPCYLPNTSIVLEALNNALSENRLAVRYLMKKLNAVELAWQEFDQEVFTNINTPQQWSNYKVMASNKLAKGQ